MIKTLISSLCISFTLLLLFFIFHSSNVSNSVKLVQVNQQQTAQTNLDSRVINNHIAFPTVINAKPDTTSDLTHLLSNVKLRALNRNKLKQALKANPEQLLDYIKNNPNIDEFVQRIILDVVYQFSDQYREQVGLEMMYAKNPIYRSAGYQLLASAGSEDDTLTSYYIGLVTEASYTETDIDVLTDIMTIYHTQTISDGVKPKVISRLSPLLAHQNTNLQIEALKALLNVTDLVTSTPYIVENLAAQDTSKLAQTIDILYSISTPPAKLAEELEILSQSELSTPEIKQAALAVIQHWQR